ncbi:unnamed protein product [Ambrosiozyma monospora]|uniref:Unnamed protein product n=1 Tax=Ambrosiozyma monospora TaxID=43982 RepID=A0ACB5SXY8_AMBMO|nr:unnamed protein product [Ambrosiozyma monospora]
MLKTIRNFEDRFNHNYHYDWIFANNEPFSEDFKAQVSNMCSGTVKFIVIPKPMWDYPDFIDQEKAARTREKMGRRGIKYGDLESYRHMCRFFSGLFFQMDEFKKYKYVWRVEPDVQFNCNMNYDPFKIMRENDKVYGFTMAPLELHTTVQTLWASTLEYMKTFPERIATNNNFAFLTDDRGKSFNMCHFWSNFEIADMDFYRSEEYMHFFNFLDQKGGIYYERWGDAPIHSIGVSILLPYSKLQYFGNTGYYHAPNLQCDGSDQMLIDNQCVCDPKRDFTWSDGSCIPKFFEIHGSTLQRPDYVPEDVKYLPIHSKNLRRLALKSGGVGAWQEEFDFPFDPAQNKDTKDIKDFKDTKDTKDTSEIH